MTETEKLLSLAERVEQAKGPDRELDARIYEIQPEAIDYQRIAIRLPLGSRPDRYHDGWVTVYGSKGEGDPHPEELPRYTASLDAAMTLLPEGAKVVEFHQDGAHEYYWWCWISDADAEGSALSKSAPHAFTAACLRARARGEG